MKGMRVLSTAAVCVSAAALLAGCGQALSPAQAPAPFARTADSNARCSAKWIRDGDAIHCRASRGVSWMKGATSGPLLYVSDIGAEAVDVFSYPDEKLVGRLKGFDEPNSLCADAKGDVFVTDTYKTQIVEYAHGGTKPIARLGGAGFATDCAIDPKSGDLAVTDYSAETYGDVEIYAGAKGSPVTLKGLYRTFFCTYDSSGDLFVDGFNSQGGAAVAELAKGSAEFALLRWGTNYPNVGWSGGMQWDGKNLLMGDQYANKFVSSRPYVNAVYTFSLSDGYLNWVRTTPLDKGEDIVQFWLQGKTIIGPDARSEYVENFNYPKGGDPTKMLGGFFEPVGAAVSE